MLITNQTNEDYWFGPLHIDAGVGQTLTVDDTTETSLYLTDDAVADAINNLYLATPAKITVSGAAQPFPRPTGVPQLLHGDGSPEGLVYAPQGSIYMRRDNTGATSSLYAKTTGVTISTGWQAVGAETEVAPSGIIEQYGGTTAPTGWLLCDGSAVSRTTYDALFAVISTAYGAGDGSTTFNLPDMRGRVPAGFAASGGHPDVSTLGNSDGVAEQYRRPKHRHTPHSHEAIHPPFIDGTAQTGTAGSGPIQGGLSGDVSTATADGGSGNANDSLDAPAYLVVNYIIKT